MNEPSISRWSLQEQSEASGVADARRRRFRLVALGGSSSLSLLLVLAVAVLVHREKPFYFESPGWERTGLKSVYDRQLGWRNPSNWNATTYGRPVTTNSRGLRDREYPFKKPPGVKRILLLGDSYVWGYGVADDEIFTEVLERRLEGRQPAWEVINAAVCGWGTDQEYLFLEQEGLKYEPDIVVVAYFVGNDTHNNASSKQYGIDKPVFVNLNLELANVPVPRPKQQRPPIVSSASPLALTVAILERMAQVCQRHDCRLVVMKFGMFLSEFHTPDFEEIGRYVGERVPRLPNTHYLDLDTAFSRRGLSADELLKGNYDGHWNAFGHGETAAILYEFLVRSGLIE